MKKKSKGPGRRPKVARKGKETALTIEQGGVPAVIRGEVMVSCPVHISVAFRAGGFCEKCYAETAMSRIKSVDDALADTVVARFAELVKAVLDSGNLELVERFLGRVMARFDKPKQSQVSATLKAVHLHAPVDFGRKPNA